MFDFYVDISKEVWKSVDKGLTWTSPNLYPPFQARARPGIALIKDSIVIIGGSGSLSRNNKHSLFFNIKKIPLKLLINMQYLTMCGPQMMWELLG